MKRNIFLGLTALIIGCTTDSDMSSTDIEDKPTLEYEIPTNKLEDEIKKTQEIFSTFPEKIDGAKKIIKYEVTSAKYILVHVRQVHHAGLETDRQRSYITSVQIEIEHILLDLKEKNNIKIAYPEGRTVNGTNALMSVYTLRRSLDEEEEKINFIISTLYTTAEQEQKEESMNRIREEYARMFADWENEYRNLQKDKEEDIDRIFYKSGALEKLARKGVIEIKGCEEQDANIKAGIALEKGEKNNKYIFDIREDIALSIIAKEKQPLNILVFGYAHNFYDNILFWNKVHPNEKFALIEITPISVPERNEPDPYDIKFHADDLHLMN